MASAAEAKRFINTIAPAIQAEAKRRGYLVCSAAIAQACIESRYGLSSLGCLYHNYFGMKCGRAWQGKSVNLKTREEYTVGTLTTIKDNFRVYDSMEQGVSGYYDFISMSRYANLKTAKTPLEYLERIKADGYATSSTYVSTNMGVVNKYDLGKWDKALTYPEGAELPDNVFNGNPFVTPEETLRRGSRGSGVKWLQYALNTHGYRLDIDGIFGDQTEDAVRKFQNEKYLVCDGIVGSKTKAALIK